jgi:cation diffusion facilitator family transporter
MTDAGKPETPQGGHDVTMNEAAARAALKRRVALISVGASVVVTMAKFAAAFVSGSLALLVDAAHGIVDIAATSLTYYAVRAAEKPADEEHHYGHGKIESVAALAEAAVLFVLAGVAIVEAGRRLIGGGGDGVEVTWFAIGVLAFAMIIDAGRWRALTIAARETKSQALEADALHFAADFLSSVVVLGAFGAAALGYPGGDAIAAIVVAVLIAIAAVRLARRTLDTLLDAAPRGLAERVREVAAAVPGVLRVDSVRLRPAGDRVFGEVDVGVARTLPLERVAELKKRVAADITSDIREAEVVVATHPVALDDETVLERIMLIAAKRRVPVHHVTVQEVEGRLSVSLDVEIDGRMSLGAAHTIATRIEGDIRDELGPQVEVETHIEPLDVHPFDGRDTDAPTQARIASLIEGAAAEGGMIHDVHKVRVRETEAGLVVNFHCRADPSLDVARVHVAVDAIERATRAGEPRIIRIVGHAEPPPMAG